MSTHTKIFTGTAILVARLSQLLQEKEITSLIKDNQESARLAGFGLTGDAVELFVLDVDKERSMQVVENFKKEILK